MTGGTEPTSRSRARAAPRTAMPRTVEALLAAARRSLGQRLTPQEAAGAMVEGALLIDIRGDDQRRVDGDIAGAIVMPRNSLEWRCDPRSPWHHPSVTGHDQQLILVCNEGFQSSLAAATLRRMGMHRTTDVQGGFIAWRATGMPVVTRNGTASAAAHAESFSSAAHWDDRYQQSDAASVSWHEAEPRTSLELIDRLHLDVDSPVVDVGGGASKLTAALAVRGFTDLTLLDVSVAALTEARRTLSDCAPGARLLQQDVLTWRPPQRFGLWHDRAVLHFFVDIEQRARYLSVLTAAVVHGGHAIIGTFAEDGPERCSGLPVVRYPAGRLAELLAPDFDIVDERRALHRTPASVVQPFLWSTFTRR